jgi:putative phosphoribosyl transferase
MNTKATTTERLVRIAAAPLSLQKAAGPIILEGTLSLPSDARGIVAFAHGSGSSRHSPRNRHVAQLLQEAGFATLLFDLLSVDEETEDSLTGRLRFDIDLLTRRLISATTWLAADPDTQGLPLGYFGASTGAGAALVAAAERPDVVRAVVSRGGRPDLAGSALEHVQAPTLLIVGGNDPQMIALNREALRRLLAPRHMEIVPGATHLFEEPGTLDRVAELARDWFAEYLIPAGAKTAGAGHIAADVVVRS